MSNDADQPNSVIYENCTHSWQNLEIYCTFIGWSLLPPSPAPPQKKHTKSSQRIMAGENWERPTNSTWRSDPWHNTTATIAPVGGSKPQALGNVVGRRISGYVKWSEFAVSAWRGWRYWLYDYMIMIFLELVRLHAVFDWGCLYFIQGVGYLKLTRIKNVKGLRVQRRTVWNS